MRYPTLINELGLNIHLIFLKYFNKINKFFSLYLFREISILIIDLFNVIPKRIIHPKSNYQSSAKLEMLVTPPWSILQWQSSLPIFRNLQSGL